jgi:hypothetical protein
MLAIHVIGSLMVTIGKKSVCFTPLPPALASWWFLQETGLCLPQAEVHEKQPLEL